MKNSLRNNAFGGIVHECANPGPTVSVGGV
jgi:hypothetical protein